MMSASEPAERSTTAPEKRADAVVVLARAVTRVGLASAIALGALLLVLYGTESQEARFLLFWCILSAFVLAALDALGSSRWQRFLPAAFFAYASLVALALPAQTLQQTGELPPLYVALLVLAIGAVLLPLRGLIFSAVAYAAVAGWLAWRSGGDLFGVINLASAFLIAGAIFVVVAWIRKNQEESIHAWSAEAITAEQEMAGILDATPAALIAFDASFRVRRINQRAQERLAEAYGIEAQPGTTDILDRLPHSSRLLLRDAGETALSGTHRTVEADGFLADEGRHVRADFHPVEADGAPGFVMLVQDASREKDVKEAARFEADRARRALLNAVGHELNTPTTPLLLKLAALQRGAAGPITNEQSLALHDMRRNLDVLAHRIQDLLEVAALDPQAIPLRREDVDLISLVESMVDGLEGADEETGPYVVSTVDSLRVWADPSRIHDLLKDIFSSMQLAEQHVKVVIRKDRGMAVVDIPMREQNDIRALSEQGDLFSPLLSGQKASEDGLHLDLARSVVVARAHGGDLVATRTRDVGDQVVRLTLPLAGRLGERAERLRRRPPRPKSVALDLVEKAVG